MFKFRKSLMGASLLAGLASPALVNAAAINFDADGNGGNAGTVLINQFGWDTGNALSIGGNQAVQDFIASGGTVQTPLTLLYHTRLVNLTDPGSNDVTPTGLNTQYEITVVTGFREVVTGIAGGVASFGNLAGGTNFFEIYFDSTPDSDFLTGQGFNDGLLIGSGSVSVVNSFFAAFDPQFSPVQNLDQAGLGAFDNYPMLDTVQGIGVTQLMATADVNTLDFAFFRDNPLALVFDAFRDANMGLPFKNVDPSAAFVFGPGGVAPTTAGAGLGANYGPNGLGDINGMLPIGANPGDNLGGPSVQFEARAQNTFQVTPGIVPEPASAALGLIGLAGLALRGRRNRIA